MNMRCVPMILALTVGLWSCAGNPVTAPVRTLKSVPDNPPPVAPVVPNPRDAKDLVVDSCANPSTTADRESRRAVVFIHGFRGAPFDTWKSSNGRYFFEFLFDDQDFEKGNDVFVVGYPADLRQNHRIRDAVEALQVDLHKCGVFARREVVFVAHSMGGLVVLEYLLSNAPDATKVPVAFLFGTPLAGSEMASFASWFTANGGAAALVPGSEFLESLRQRWERTRASVSVPTVLHCGYETEPVPPYGLVVKALSATQLCPETRGVARAGGWDNVRFPVLGNHMEVVKPKDGSARSIEAVKQVLGDLDHRLSITPKTRTRQIPIKEEDFARPSNWNDIEKAYCSDRWPCGTIVYGTDKETKVPKGFSPTLKFKMPSEIAGNVTAAKLILSVGRPGATEQFECAFAPGCAPGMTILLDGESKADIGTRSYVSGFPIRDNCGGKMFCEEGGNGTPWVYPLREDQLGHLKSGQTVVLEPRLNVSTQQCDPHHAYWLLIRKDAVLQLTYSTER